MKTQQIQRRYDLDWLRVITILAIFVFHCTRLFDTDDWTIKNPTTYLFVDAWNRFATSWGMPLILIISGASVFYALGKVSPGKYVKGILVRLFIPLVFGIFTHIVLQVYLENLNKGTFSGSFIDFYPHYFDGMYGFGGNFAWMGLHLWYLELLFILSLLFLPLFLWLKHTSSGRFVLKGLGNLLALPGAVFLFALPVTGGTCPSRRLNWFWTTGAERTRWGWARSSERGISAQSRSAGWESWSWGSLRSTSRTRSY